MYIYLKSYARLALPNNKWIFFLEIIGCTSSKIWYHWQQGTICSSTFRTPHNGSTVKHSQFWWKTSEWTSKRGCYFIISEKKMRRYSFKTIENCLHYHKLTFDSPILNTSNWKDFFSHLLSINNELNTIFFQLIYD